MTFQRLSGLAAIAAGVTYIIGFWVYFTVLGPAQYGAATVPASDHVRFLIEHEALMISWNLVIYVLNAVLMVLIVIGLHDRISDGQGVLARIATVFGLIWAGLILAAGMVFNVGIARIVALYPHDPDAARNLWHGVVAIGSGLGGGNEITGGMWIALLSLAAWRSRALPRLVSALGLIVGGAGLASTAPALSDATVVFGLGFIVWFFAMGAVLMLSRSPAGAQARA